MKHKNRNKQRNAPANQGNTAQVSGAAPQVAERRFEAASTAKRLSKWQATSGSANYETMSAISMLRNRSRDLVRNNPYAKRAITTITTNCIGSGIRSAPAAETPVLDKKIKKLWKDWAGTTACDWDGQLTFSGIQRQVMRAVAESGEAFILRRRVADPNNPFKLQVLEADFLDSNKNTAGMPGAGYVVQGVEFDKSGQRVAYWLWNQHPGDVFRTEYFSRSVPAADVLHIYKAERPQQVRGIPFGVSAMLRLKDFDEYEDAQLLRQKIAACWSVFIYDSTEYLLGSGNTPKTPAELEEIEVVEPGSVEYLPPGKDVKFANPPGAEGYDVYTKKILQAVAAGFGVTYESLTTDYSNVNFSSARMAWLEFARTVEEWQSDMVIPKLCIPVFNWWLKGLVIGDVINAKAAGMVTCNWTPPRREMIDPTKETEAMLLQVTGGLISYSEAVRQLGYDPEETVAEIAKDYALFDKHKLKLLSDVRVVLEGNMLKNKKVG